MSMDQIKWQNGGLSVTFRDGRGNVHGASRANVEKTLRDGKGSENSALGLTIDEARILVASMPRMENV